MSELKKGQDKRTIEILIEQSEMNYNILCDHNAFLSGIVDRTVGMEPEGEGKDEGIASYEDSTLNVLRSNSDKTSLIIRRIGRQISRLNEAL